MGYKILIVDDEPFIRHGINVKLDRNKLNIDEVEEAEDGIDALSKVEGFKPDIIITDIRMPEMDGLSMIKEIIQKNCIAQFIIISGFAEFEYAKKAIQFGVKNYILKPIDPEELEAAVKNITATMEEINKDREKVSLLQEVVEKTRIDEFDKTLNELLNDYSDEIEYRAKLDKAKLNFKKEQFVLAVLRIKPVSLNRIGFNMNEDELFMFCIRNVINEAIINLKNVIYFKNYRAGNEFIFILNQDKIEYNFISNMMKDIIDLLKRYLKIESVVGIGDICSSLSLISKSYNQAEFALNERILKGYNKVFLFKSLKSEHKFKGTSRENMRDVLMAYFKENDMETASKYIHNIFNDIIQKDDSSFPDLRNVCIDIYVSVKDYLYMNGHSMDMLWGEKYEFVDEVFQFDSVEEIYEWIKSSITALSKNIGTSNKYTGQDIVNEVVSFLRTNYREDISLSLISRKYFINSNYFSRIFKEIVGKSFNDYITGMRMSKACELMKNTDLNISHISRLVGYEEPKYFSKVFKKELGMAPSEYTDRIRMN